MSLRRRKQPVCKGVKHLPKKSKRVTEPGTKHHKAASTSGACWIPARVAIRVWDGERWGSQGINMPADADLAKRV